jgi:hypothetical protein
MLSSVSGPMAMVSFGKNVLSGTRHRFDFNYSSLRQKITLSGHQNLFITKILHSSILIFLLRDCHPEPLFLGKE